MDAPGLRRCRKRSGLTAEQVAQRMGLSVVQIYRYESGTSGIPLARLHEMAEIYHCPVNDLLAENDDVKEESVPIVKVPLISWVEAGSLTEICDPYELGDAEKYVDLPYSKATLIALRVHGNSMNRVAADGALIAVDYSEKDLISGKYYVVKLGDGATFKRYRDNPPRFEADSSEPHDTIFPDGPVEVVGRVVKVIHDL